MLIVSQEEFAKALLDPSHTLPDGLTSHSFQHPEKRFAVYRNNVVASLIDALRTRFPATERILGEEFFAAMARIFLTWHPPRSRILHTYGEDFGDFIAAFEPAAELPYLPDVARLEAARTRAYHATDAVSLDASALTTVKPDAIGQLRFTFHPSLRMIRSRHPVVTIWAMNAGDRPIGPVDETIAEDALILRPQFDVIVRALPPGGAAFLAALSSGLTLADAAAAAAHEDANFDLTANLAGLIGSGAVTAFSIAKDPMP